MSQFETQLKANPAVAPMAHKMALQQELMAAISHEIRTPVARLSFAVQLLLDSLPQQVPSTQQRHQLTLACEEMLLDLQEINDLVEEVMTYTHLEDGGPTIEFKSTPLMPLLSSVLGQYADYDDYLDMQISVPREDLQETDLCIDAEPVQLRRALQNLVGNAVKYASSKVVIGYRLVDGQTCEVYVSDDGPGIPAADYGKVFAPFSRLDISRSKDTGGFGLGLSIVRRIAYWHGGRAEAGRSKRLGGARMCLRLPLRQTQASRPILEPQT